MSRTLNRPMFRRGGKVDSRGTGITSGLMPRKNFEEGGRAEQIAEEMQNIQDLKNQFGLNYEMPEPEKGLALSDYINLIGRGAQTAFGERKDLGENIQETTGELASNIQARKIKEQQDKEKAFGVRSGEFGAAQDVVNQRIANEKRFKEENIQLDKKIAAEKEIEESKLSAGSSYEIGFRLAQLKLDYDQDIILAGDDQDKKDSITRQYSKDRTNLITKTKSENLVATALLNNKDFVDKIKKKSDAQLKNEASIRLTEEGKTALEIAKYLESQEFAQIKQNAFLQILAGYATVNAEEILAGQELKDGGRVGLAQGGIPDTGMADQSVAQNNTGLSFEEVRSRLPQEISDEIVNLIISSPMAFEDFAALQTQMDVANFNAKYNVNLSLPQDV